MLFNFQAQVFFYLLAILFLLSCIWFFLLHRFFEFIRNHNSELYQSVGSPDFKRFRSGNDIAIIKYIFSELEVSNDSEEARKKKNLRHYFLFYLGYSILLICYIVFSSVL
jgi:hypothetical protein